MKSITRILIAGITLTVISFTPPSTAETLVDNPPPTLDGIPDAQVDEHTGAMTTAFRITLPAARGLPQPQLNLRYNSSMRDREVGYGWGLDLPVIERKPLSGWPASNPDSSPVGQERYTFSGKELVRICVVGRDVTCPIEPYPVWANGWTYYRLQVEGMFARFYQSEDRRSWRVQLKGGEQLDFGKPRSDDPQYAGFSDNVEFDSHVTGGASGPIRWRLARQIDAAHPKNFIVYRWQSASRGGGLLYLKDIFYTPPVDVSAPTLDAFAHHVQLDWEQQPYPTSSYLNPDKATLNMRLTRIAVASKSWTARASREFVRQYVLSYYDDRASTQGGWANAAPLWHHSFLKSVQINGRCQEPLHEANGVIPLGSFCSPLPETHFEYSTGEVRTQTSYRSSILDGPPNAAQDNKVFPYPASTAIVDFNRDGLPDVVQGWDGPHEPLEIFPGVSSCIREIYTYIGNGATDPGSFEGELWFHCKDLNDEHHNKKLRSARPILGYLNEGMALLGAGAPQLRYQCMDAGGAGGGIALINGFQQPPDGRVKATFFSVQGSSVVGNFSHATVLWQNDQLYPVVAHPITYPAHSPGSEHPNFALGGCSMTAQFDKNHFYPRWSWELSNEDDWMKHAKTPTPTPNDWVREPAWFVDIDGDGFPDKLVEDSPSFDVAPDLKRARVAYIRHFTSAEGPPQSQPDWNGPFVSVAERSLPNSIVPARTRRKTVLGPPSSFWYADVNGDGIVDLVSSYQGEDLGVPRVRPGDGRGGFGCLSQYQPPSLSCQTAASGPGFYTLSFTNSPNPFEVGDYNHPGFQWTPATVQFHDVTGDGLADIVARKEGFVYVWVNKDGQHFDCFGTDPKDRCRVGELRPANYDGGRLSFADMDGNGIDEVVVLFKSGLHVVSVFNHLHSAFAPRPGLLIGIRNAGTTTSIRYNTLAAVRSAFAAADQPWTHTAPIAANVVSEIRTQDVVTSQGASMPQPFRVNRAVRYSYIDPAYDRWKRQLVGFRKIRKQVAGEAALTETTYWYGPCEHDTVAGRALTGSAPAPLCAHGSDDEDFGGIAAPTFRGLVGRPIRVDHYVPRIGDEQPERFLWSRYTTYSPVKTLLAPAGERKVTFVYPMRIETHHYDTNLPVVRGATELVTTGGDLLEHAPTQTGERIVIQEMDVDSIGSLMFTRDFGDQAGGDRAVSTEYWAGNDGSVRGARCDANWRCTSPRQQVRLQDASGAWETTSAWIKTELYPNGDVHKISTLSNRPSLGLQRANAFGAYSPGFSAHHDWKMQAEYHYDPDSGTVDEVRGPGESNPVTQSCTRIVLDEAYREFPVKIRQFKHGCGSPNPLETDVTFDRAFGIPIASTAPDGGLTTMELDAFGRTKKIFVPDPEDSLATQLAAEVEYHDQSPLSYIDVKQYSAPGAFIQNVMLLNAVSEPVLRFSTGDRAGSWIVDGWTERDGGARPRLIRRPFSSTQNPHAVANTASAVPPPAGNGWFTTSRDLFERTSIISENDIAIRHHTYGALTVSVRDAMQLAGAPNDGAATTVRLNGRGVVKEVIQHRPSGVFASSGDIKTAITYDGLGYPLAIARFDSAYFGPAGYMRTMVWDAFGNLLENNEPNTSQNGRNWRYIYDDANRLSGTSDARGCGKDIYYDGLGRVTAEDYSPCTAMQSAYSSPSDLSPFEVEYVYDQYEDGQIFPELGYSDDPSAAEGRLVAVRDRGAYTRFNYDHHGRVRRVARRIALPESAPHSSDQYTSHWFSSRTDYDLAGRVTRKTSGADDPYLLNASGLSEERYSYSRRGFVGTVDSSYGPLIRLITYDADGLVGRVLYGDRAYTSASRTFDSRRRLSTYDVMRLPSMLWTTHTPPNYPQPSWETTQTELARFSFRYDAVGNPTSIDDQTDPNQYRRDPFLPIPRRSIEYDDLYRVTLIDHRYDRPPEYRPLYGPELGTGDTKPVPQQVPPSRMLGQTFSYDYLGNIVQSTDDLNLRYDRSLGDITYGGAATGPNQFQSSEGISARHDAAGNLVELKVERSEPCLHPAGSRCAQWFAYDWDEVGNLARARRWDFETTLPVLPSGTPPSTSPSWDLHYGYSLGNRVLKSGKEAAGPERHTVDVFDSLRLYESEFDTTAQPGDYQRDRDTMHVFLAGGMARVFFDRTMSLPRPPTADFQHVYLQIGDHLGSSTAVIDHGTGELVERTTYQAYGAIESDFRPARWHSAREPLKFAGKEEDIEVGLTYFGARYYHPHLGRWASADPLTIHGFGGDLNPYAYVGGRTMSHFDPLGLIGEPLDPPPNSLPPMDDTSWWVPPSQNGLIGNMYRAQHSATSELSLDGSCSVCIEPYVPLGGADMGGPNANDLSYYEVSQFAAQVLMDEINRRREEISARMVVGLVSALPVVGTGLMAAEAMDKYASPASRVVAASGVAISVIPVLGAARALAAEGGGSFIIGGGAIGGGGEGPVATFIAGPGGAVVRTGLSPAELLMPNGIKIGQAGASSSIRVIQGGTTEAGMMFEQLSVGGTPLAGGYPGSAVMLPGEGFVGMRTFASGTGARALPAATLDVNIPGIGIRELKFVQ